mgnify:CR=1 FL=1
MLSPGRIEAGQKYQEFCFDLYQAGFTVHLIDHRGQGASDRVSADRHLGDVADFQHYVQDVGLFMAKFSSQMPGPKLLMAHSMGGAIASAYLAKAPKQFVAAAGAVSVSECGPVFHRGVARRPRIAGWRASSLPASPAGSASGCASCST